MRSADLAELLREVTQAVPVPIHAVVSDAQKPIRLAVQDVLPAVPHQLCHFHYLKELAKPITAADSAAKTDLKQYVRGIRDVERSVATRDDTAAEVVRAPAWPCARRLRTTPSRRSGCPGSCCMTACRPSRTRSTGCWQKGGCCRAGEAVGSGGHRLVCHGAALGTATDRSRLD